jgi:hypothetical protein
MLLKSSPQLKKNYRYRVIGGGKNNQVGNLKPLYNYILLFLQQFLIKTQVKFLAISKDVRSLKK